MTNKPSLYIEEKRILTRIPYALILFSLLVIRGTLKFHATPLINNRIINRLLITVYKTFQLHEHAGTTSHDRWLTAQQLYQTWAKNPLPQTYVETIRVIGRKFAQFIEYPVGYCLDVGCGNGLIGGHTYQELNFYYMTPQKTDFVNGVDPLPIASTQLQPWLNIYTQKRIEDLPETTKCNTIVMSTTVYHFENPERALRKAYSLLWEGGKLYIWLTCYHIEPYFAHDPNHAERFTQHKLESLLHAIGFAVSRRYVEPWGAGADTVFIEATK